MKGLKNKIKNMKGITLISLVVTIIVLIILAGVTLNMLLGENGIINRTKTARDENEKATATETMNLKITNVQMSKYAEEQRMPTLKELADNFCEDDDFQYVQETSEVASLTPISNNNPTSIYTKLKAYPYEFEINSSLQLASIDGIKVASNEDTSTQYVKKSDYDQLVSLVASLSQKVTNLENDNKAEIGTIIAYSVNNVPDGYLKCEGQAVSRTEYSDLFEKIGTTYGSGDGSTTFNVPDLRGEFLRGTGTNGHTNQGSGEDVGEHQDATEHPLFHFHNRAFQTNVNNSTANVFNKDSLHTSDKEMGSTSINAFIFWDGYGDANRTAFYSSRPTNTSVLYCIKY